MHKNQPAAPDGRMGVRHHEISADEAGQRLDNFLLRTARGVPRSHIYRLIRTGQVRVNGARARPTRKLESGDQVRLPPLQLSPGKQPLRVPDAVIDRVLGAIVHCDDDWLLVNKPIGLAVHGGSGLDFGLVDALRQGREETAIDLVHRLDRDTSGLMLFSRRRSAQRQLQQAFRERQVQKRYLALTTGLWPDRCAEVDAPLAANKAHAGERRVQVDPLAGQPALTRFQILEHFGADATLVEAEPVTGRTHQIRVHAAHVGHALVGDRRYADHASERRLLGQLVHKRLYLHACALSFPWGGERLSFELAPDERWQQALVRLRVALT